VLKIGASAGLSSLSANLTDCVEDDGQRGDLTRPSGLWEFDGLRDQFAARTTAPCRKYLWLVPPIRSAHSAQTKQLEHGHIEPRCSRRRAPSRAGGLKSV